MAFAAIFGMLCGMENDLKMDTRKNPENLYAVRMMIVRLNKQGLGPMAIKEHHRHPNRIGKNGSSTTSLSILRNNFMCLSFHFVIVV